VDETVGILLIRHSQPARDRPTLAIPRDSGQHPAARREGQGELDALSKRADRLVDGQDR
jgi:hypothetical protein